MSGLFTRNRLIGLALAALVAVIDQISLERKVAPGMAIWREALERLMRAAKAMP